MVSEVAAMVLQLLFDDWCLWKNITTVLAKSIYIACMLKEADMMLVPYAPL
jgi:hypothetical protein